uniref:EF-hand domain-containing protein n=1 Tax=Parascaris univalens TaxID=6257 RepID=A0A915CF70_PARUN
QILSKERELHVVHWNSLSPRPRCKFWLCEADWNRALQLQFPSLLPRAVFDRLSSRLLYSGNRWMVVGNLDVHEKMVVKP